MRWSELTLCALIGLKGVYSHSVVDPLMELRAVQGNKLFISTDGSCGPGITCLGSGFGSCCGAHGYCGSGNMACGAGCRPEYGTCPEKVVLQSRAVGDDLVGARRRSGELAISQDGSCGVSSTCLGSKAGECCSRDGWCGSSQSYCGAGCREGFGRCGGLELRQVTEEDEACDAPSSTETVSSSSAAAAASSSSAAASTSTSVAAAASTTPSSTAASTPAPQLSTIQTTSTAAAAASTTVRTSTVSTTSARPASVTPTPTPTPTPAPLNVSKDGKCGKAVNQTCKGSSIFVGPCCSKSGQCGLLGCLKLLGCQSAYGYCL